MEYFKLCRLPFLSALIVTIVWHFFNRYICVSKNDAGFIETWAGIIGTAHSILASLITQKVVEKDSNIKRARRSENKVEFDHYKNDRIPVLIKIFLGLLSLNIICLFMFYPFESEKLALFANFSAAFILLCWWVIATEMDDPFNGVWSIDQNDLPEGWTIK